MFLSKTETNELSDNYKHTKKLIEQSIKDNNEISKEIISQYNSMLRVLKIQMDFNDVIPAE